jgi:hypothetical protein
MPLKSVKKAELFYCPKGVLAVGIVKKLVQLGLSFGMKTLINL